MFRIVCDPSSGSIELYLTDIIRSCSQMFVVYAHMRRPNSGRFQKKPSAGASNNGRIDGASVCVRKGSTLKVIR